MTAAWHRLIAVAIAAWVGLVVAAPPKVLRVAMDAAETGFDPPRVFDTYSFAVTAHIFEAPLGYDHLARPVKLRPLTAAALPEASADFRTWTVRLKPGILFADDPAFGGKPRELVAADYVFSIKRYADPALKSQQWSDIERLRISGLDALRRAALAAERPFDYDREIPGLRALDRYTLQIKVDEPRPRLPYSLTHFTAAAVAREVVERYGDNIMEHPVGTGPFRLAQWRRSSQIVLERNPNYRDVRYAAEPAAGDNEGQALLARLQGRRLPMVDRVEISIIEAGQPRWLAFLDGDFDRLTVPYEFVALAMPGRRLAPYLERRGIRGALTVAPTVSYLYFNMDDALVGGYTPDKIALRRAIAMGIDVQREIALVRGGQALVAQSPIGAHLSGFDAEFRSEMGQYDPARAKALLDLHGYVDRDGDGWRERPDGSPLQLEVASESDPGSRRFDELMKRDMDAIGLRTVFKLGQWPENAKAARAGKLMIWVQGYGATAPDGQTALARLYGPAAGGHNLPRFKLPAFDALYERLGTLPDGPEREALFVEAKKLAVAYMPEKTTVHRMFTDLTQPWLVGFRRPLFWSNWFEMVDIDHSQRAAR